MTTEAPPPFGALLRQFRRAAGLSQEALADRAGLSVRAVRALEGGERRVPYPHTVGQLARALRLSAAERARLAATVPPRHGPAGPEAAASGALRTGQQHGLVQAIEPALQAHRPGRRAAQRVSTARPSPRRSRRVAGSPSA